MIKTLRCWLFHNSQDTREFSYTDDHGVRITVLLSRRCGDCGRHLRKPRRF